MVETVLKYNLYAFLKNLKNFALCLKIIYKKFIKGIPPFLPLRCFTLSLSSHTKFTHWSLVSAADRLLLTLTMYSAKICLNYALSCLICTGEYCAMHCHALMNTVQLQSLSSLDCHHPVWSV